MTSNIAHDVLIVIKYNKSIEIELQLNGWQVVIEQFFFKL